MIWLSLLIPVAGAIITYIWFRHRVTLWEFCFPIIASLLFIVIFKTIVEKVEVSSTEYWGNLGITGQYYEPWSTWVDQTCTRSVPCGTDSKGNTQYCTETYDCSYCSDHSSEYKLVDDGGNKFTISESTYEYLMKRWSARPQFVDLHRSINHHWSCGQDGDLYEVHWDNQVITSVPTVRKHTYENRVKCAVSSFNYPHINSHDKEMYGLYEYPQVKGYTQKAILGDDQFSWMSQAERDTSETYAQYLCGYYGPRKQLKVWILLFKNKPSIAGDMQEAYWVNGNKNEVVVCVGVDSNSRTLQWVRAFSWTPNRTMLVDIRENLMELKSYDFRKFYPVLAKDLEGFSRRHFKEFSYISIELPTWCTVITYIVVLALTIFLCIWSVRNRFNPE